MHKKTGYYYNKRLVKNHKNGTSLQGLKGTLAVGTKLEYVHTSSRNGLKDKVYQVITETGEMAFVDATCFSFKLPKNLYIQNDTTLYKDSNGKEKISTLVVGTKVERFFSNSNYFKVKVGTKTGWVKKTDTTGKKVAKVKKSYGTYYLTQIHFLDNDTYPAGTKIVQVSPYYYEFSDWQNKSKQHKEPYDFIMGQYPDGKITGFLLKENGDINKSKQKALTVQKDLTAHAKSAEQQIFKEFNQYRKSKGIKELPWNKNAYKIADSYFNYCVKIGATDFPHIGNAHGWYVPYTDIILSGNAASINDTANVSKEAMRLWKRSAGHNDMLLDDYYESAAVAVMFNPTVQKMEAVIMCSGSNGIVDFADRDDNYIAKTWFPFIFKNPQFTKNRGDDYHGLNY